MSEKTRLIGKYKSLSKPLKASVWFFVCSFIQRAMMTITTPIFSRIMSTSEYGDFGVFQSWYGIISIIITMNLFYGVYTQGLVKFDDEAEVFSSSLQGITLTMTMLWSAVYALFHVFWNKLFSLTTTQMILLLAMVWSSAVFAFWSAEQRVKLKYNMLVIVTFVVSILQPVLGIVLILMTDLDSVTARIIGIVVPQFIMYIPLFAVQMKRGRVFFSQKFWKYVLMFNLPLVPHYLSQMVLNNADRIMIRDMVGKSEAGIYTLAYSLSLVMTMFNTVLMQTLSPWIYKSIKRKDVSDIAPVSYTSIVILELLNLMLILFAPEIIKIFAPKAFYDAIWIVPPVALSSVLLFSYDLFAKFEFYFEKTVFIMIASVSGAILNIVLNYIFIGMFGYYAAGYTTLLCYTAYVVGHYLFMNKVCKDYMDGVKPYSIVKLLQLYIPFFATGFVIMLTYKHLIIRIGLMVLMLCLAFVFRKKLMDMIKQLQRIRE